MRQPPYKPRHTNLVQFVYNVCSCTKIVIITKLAFGYTVYTLARFSFKMHSFHIVNYYRKRERERLEWRKGLGSYIHIREGGRERVRGRKGV